MEPLICEALICEICAARTRPLICDAWMLAMSVACNWPVIAVLAVTRVHAPVTIWYSLAGVGTVRRASAPSGRPVVAGSEVTR